MDQMDYGAVLPPSLMVFLLLTNWGVGGWLGQRGPINVKQSRKEEWNYPLVSVSPSVTQPSRACWFGDGYFFVWTNTFGNLDKHLWVYLLLGVLVWHSLPEHADLVMDVFIIWKNAFCVSIFIPWLCSNKWENRNSCKCWTRQLTIKNVEAASRSNEGIGNLINFPHYELLTDALDN